MSDHLLPLLRLVYSGLEGEITLVADQAEIQTGDVDAIKKFLADHPGKEILLNLHDSEGLFNYEAVVCLSADEIDAALDAMGDIAPVITVTRSVNGNDEATFLYPAGTVTGVETDWRCGSFPVPETGGWELTEKSKQSLGEHQPEASNAPAEEPDLDEPFKINDAEFISGNLPQVVMDLEFKLGFGRSRDDKRWPAKPITFAQLVGVMSKHVEGKKDGNSFLQGVAIDNERKASAISALYIVGLDVDCGIGMEPVIKKIQSELNDGRGLASIIYTTHSHMTTTTDLRQTSFNQFCKKHKLDDGLTRANVIRFLIEDRKWNQEIAHSVEIDEEPQQDSKGVFYMLKHAPIPKFRIIFPLVEPFVIAKQKMPQAEAINLWKGRLLGLAKILDLPIDESCLDPSRLFYMPRHTKGRPFRVVVTSGPALDFDAVPNVQPRAREKLDEDVFARAAKELGANAGGALIVNDLNLKGWAAQVASTFDPVKLIREVCPDRIRYDNNTEKIEIECPFDYTHSNAGDPEDRACWVLSARADYSDRGFGWGCQHNSCKNRDRLEFVAEAISHDWFTVEHLKSDDFRVFTVEEQVEFRDPKLILQEAIDEIAEIAVDSDDRATRCEEIIQRLIDKDLNPYQVGLAADAMKERRLLTGSRLKEMVKALIRKRDLNESSEKKEARLMKHAGKSKSEMTLFLITPARGYLEMRDAVRSALSTSNRPDKGRMTKIFEFGGGKFSVIPQWDDDKQSVATSYMTTSHLSNVLAQPPGLDVRRITDEGSVSVPIPVNILNEMLVDEGWFCPILNGFADLPYFNSAKQLVTKVGYDPASKMYLKPYAAMNSLKVPDKPTKEQVDAARDLLLNKVYGNFPFDDGPDTETAGDASRAHFVAMLVHPFIRRMITGPTPIYLVSKPTPGTGGTLLVETALTISSGQKGKSKTDSNNEEEQRKNITTAFISADTYFWLDNVKLELRSGAYCNLATAAVWTDRILGRSEMATYPNNMQFIIGGNNPRGTYEVMRRCVPIRLDAHGDPNKRKQSDFNIKDPLGEWVVNNHEELMTAVLTMLQAWIVSEQFDYDGPLLMSFEDWSRKMGAFLKFVGINGFLKNMHLTQKHADEETSNFEAFYQAWYKKKQGLNQPTLPSEIASMLIEMDDFPSIGVTYNDSTHILAQRLTRVLNEKQGTPYTITVENERSISVKIVKKTDEKTKQVHFMLTEMD